MVAYVRMSADLLNDRLIKVTGVAHKVLANLVRVLEAAEDIVNKRKLATLLQIHSLIFLGRMDVLDP
jgi:hypothetical protein